MTARRANLYALVALGLSALAAPSTALGTSGGAGLSSSPGSTPSQSSGVQPSNVPVTATGHGMTLTTTASAVLRRGLSFTGSTSSSAAGQTVEIERLGHQTNWQWTPTVSATVASDGHFSAVWRTNHIGRFMIRAVLGRTASTASASAAPTLTTTVYRPAVATLYGPGFYGSRTACGHKLTRSTIGVANRTLPCGSSVAILYQGKTMIVPVIDRGPYANGADWDLTMATAKALGLSGTATIGAVSLPKPPAHTSYR